MISRCKKLVDKENIEYHGEDISVDISYLLLGQNPLITFLMDETMKEKKFTLAKSGQDRCEGFHWRRGGRDNFLLALKAICQKISTFISSHLNFFLSPDSALRDD